MIDIVEDFKDRFNKALSLRNMRPVELKEKTGISESAISQYRSGYAKPKQDKLYLIAKALDVNEAWLMGLDVPMNNTPQISDDIKSLDAVLPVFNEEDIEQMIALYTAYTKAIPEIQAAVESLLKSQLPDS